jgi:protein involved in polysaccharide export with SLBB domain
MGRFVSIFLVRAAGMVLAAMLLFAVFGHARADDTNYGLKRFGGDNYDTLPPGAGIPPAPSPAGFAPVPGSTPGAASTGYYTALNPGTAPVDNGPASSGYIPAPQQVVAAAPAYQPPPSYQPQAAYQLPPVQPAADAGPYGYKPDAAQTAQPATPTPYGYKPDLAATRTAPQMPVRGAAAYAYYQRAASMAGGGANPDYVLGAGDKIHLTVFGETDLSGDFAVDGSGFIRLPLIGQVHAAGYTASQLEAAVGGALAQGYLKSPRVAVEVATYRPFYIIGAVNRPGEYPFVNHMNALNAVALAGGYTQSAVESVVFVRREGSNTEVEMPTDRSTAIYPGDVVRIHNTIFSDAMNLFSPLSGAATFAAAAAIQ